MLAQNRNNRNEDKISFPFNLKQKSINVVHGYLVNQMRNNNKIE